MTEESNGDSTSNPNSAVQRRKRIVDDALLMLDHAIESGFKTEDGRAVPDDVIASLQATGGKFQQAYHDDNPNGGIDPAEWLDFERAYYRLTTLMAPITAETLRDTEGTSKTDSRKNGAALSWKSSALAVYHALAGYSPAQRFTRGLWIVAIFFAGFVILSEWYLLITASSGDEKPVFPKRSLVELLVPWAYGGLGSCVYLLKSAHNFIHQRTFDLRRKPEYFNRILLGTISGGAIILFVSQIMADDGETVRLSAAALGFLAGYSTEFLFSTIERVIAAILPKVGIDTVATQRIAPVRAPDVSELAALYGQAKSKEDREVFRALIEQVTKGKGA